MNLPKNTPLDQEHEYLMVRAAKLYYDLEQNQSEIATAMGLTRWQVGRLLKEARELGIVDIRIIPHSPRRTDLEGRLQKLFDLEEAIVVPVNIDDDAITRDAIARAAAQFILSLAPKPRLIGVSWGRTMAAVAHRMAPNWNDGVHIVLLNGATSRLSASSPNNNVAERLAVTGRGTATLLPVPAILGSSKTRQALEDDPMVSEVLDLAREAPVVCFGLGELSRHSVLVSSGYLTEADIDGLRHDGAVGDILGRFVDGTGRIVNPSLDARTLGLELDALPRKQLSIGVAGGRTKHEIVLASLRAHYVNVLVSDENTAAFLLGDPS